MGYSPRSRKELDMSEQLHVHFSFHRATDAPKLQASSQDENVVLACSEGGVFGFLTSEGHQSDTHACPVERLMVSTSLNKPKPKLNTADSKFLKNILGKYLIVKAWRTCKFLLK